MVLCKPVAPENYGKMQDLYTVVSNNIKARGVARPDHISKLLGEGAVKPYYFMDALMRYLEYSGGKWVLKYIRRDMTPAQLHALDSAFKPGYRSLDNESSSGRSGYPLISREKNGLLVHDLGEVFGKTVLGALVVNYGISCLLGEDTGKNANLLTNENGLVLAPLKDEIKELLNVSHNSVYEFLGRKIVSFKERYKEKTMATAIRLQYQKILDALTSFQTHVQHIQIDYMPRPQKKDLLGIVNEMSNNVLEIKNNEFLKLDYVRKYIIKQNEHVREIMRNGKRNGYNEVDTRLILPDEPEFLLTLNKTLYDDYLKNIAETVKRDAISASQNGNTGDSYLSPMMEKVADATDVVSKMDHNSLQNDTSIFRKARIVVERGVELCEYLKKGEINCERLHLSTDYLFRNLNVVIDEYLEGLQKITRRETHFERNLETFELMKEKMGGFEKRIAAMRQQNQTGEGATIDSKLKTPFQLPLPLFKCS